MRKLLLDIGLLLALDRTHSTVSDISYLTTYLAWLFGAHEV